MNKQFKNQNQAILLGIGITLFIIVAFTLTSPTKKTSEEKATRKVFIENCNITGELENYCGCAYDNIVDEVGVSGMYDIAQNFDGNLTNKQEDIVFKAVNNCTHLIK